MPAPAVYVVFAVVGAFATGFTIKHFVYDPHVGPWIRDWRGRRRAPRDPQQQFHNPVPATTGRGPLHRSHTPPIELDTVATRNIEERSTSANIRRRQTNNAPGDRISDEVESPLISPSTPIARSPSHLLRSPPNETTPMLLSPSMSSPAALPLASFAIDVDYTASSVDVTPLVQSSMLQSNLASPQLTGASPFSDIFELAQSHMSEVEITHAGSGSEDDAFSVPSSVSSVTATDDDDDDSVGSAESWHDIRSDLNRS